MRDFEGRTVVVTGASRGLGLGCAAAFAARGAHVVMVSRGADELEAAAASLRAAGGDARAAPCDVTDPSAVVALFATFGAYGVVRGGQWVANVVVRKTDLAFCVAEVELSSGDIQIRPA